MKIIISSFFMVILSLLTGCSSDKGFPYPELLPTQDGKYSVLVIDVQKENNRLENPKFLDEAATKGILSNLRMTSSNNERIKEEYPKLKLESVPVVVIMDKNGVLLKTSDIGEAEKYLNTLN